jgi:hypothetical protein
LAFGNLPGFSPGSGLATSRVLPSFEGVPLLRFILTSLIVAAGVIGAVLLMLFGLVMFFLSRLFGVKTQMPRFQATFHRSSGRPTPPRAPSSGDVIDVIATEVKDDSARTQPRLNG